MKILSLGQTIAFSHKSKQYVSCFAGYSLDTQDLIRVFPCEIQLNVGTEYDLDISKSKNDDRCESYVFSSKNTTDIKKWDSEDLINLLASISTNFESAFDSDQTLAVVQLSKYQYSHGEKTSIVQLEDINTDTFVSKIFSVNLSPRYLSNKWDSSDGKVCYALIGNKKNNGEWITINVLPNKHLEQFDRTAYMKKYMREKRSQN